MTQEHHQLTHHTPFQKPEIRGQPDPVTFDLQLAAKNFETRSATRSLSGLINTVPAITMSASMGAVSLGSGTRVLSAQRSQPIRAVLIGSQSQVSVRSGSKSAGTSGQTQPLRSQ